MELELPYGRTPLRFDADPRLVEVLRGPALPPPPLVDDLVAAALESPIASPSLARLAPPGSHVTVIVSDSTRDEPRGVFLTALRGGLADVRWTIAIATGTHGPCRLDDLQLPAGALRDATLVNHDGHDPTDLVELGTTARGTPVRVHRCVVDADLVVATGCIRPHYFAGFGAGAKAVFPGLGEATAIRINHRLKTDARALAGVVDANPCRADLDEAVGLVRTPMFLLDGVCGPDGRVHAAVAGDLHAAFRRGTELARGWSTVRARPATLVIASDSLPVSASLYQAAKIAAATAALVAPDGTLVIAAECPDGIGPLETVNEAILRIGVLPRLPPGARLLLVSSLSPDLVARTLAGYAPAIPKIDRRTVVVPHASRLICEQSS